MPARILVVEDHPANLQLMTYLLRCFAHEVLTASDGAAALEAVRREALDLIICDLQLPKVDGYEVAQRLKSDPTSKAIPLVAVTALAMVGDRDKALTAGFDGYISKPIVPRTFVEQVEAFLPVDLHSPPRAHVPPLSGIRRPQGHKAKILVVDNLPVNITLARKILEPSGYQVLAAAGVQDALALTRQEVPDLILTDLHMPGGSGHDLLRAVKADPRLQAIPCMLISSSNWDHQDEKEARALGAAQFLSRPIDPQALLAEIEACLLRAREA